MNSTPVTMRLAEYGEKPIPKRFNFTMDSLARLAIPTERREAWVWDTKVPFLAFRLRATGGEGFYLYRRIGGRPQKMRLGGRELTIEQARNKAQELNGEIAKDNDPSALRRATRKSETLRELWERYLAEHIEARCTEKTRITDKSRFDTCLKSLASRRILTIHENDVIALHTRIGRERGHVSANRAVQLLRRLFNFARIGHNPASKAVAMFEETSRERFVQPDELPKLFKALNADDVNPLVRDYLYVSLYTGARRANVQAMRAEQINLKAATWTIPAGESKNGKAMTIPLVPAAIEIIVKRMGHESGFVFPGNGASGHLVEPKATWMKVLKSAGLKDVRLHDLRRTFGSFQAATGASLPIIGKSLGHRDSAATQIYSRLNLDPVRASVTGAVNAMIAAGNMPETDGSKQP